MQRRHAALALIGLAALAFVLTLWTRPGSGGENPLGGEISEAPRHETPLTADAKVAELHLDPDASTNSGERVARHSASAAHGRLRGRLVDKSGKGLAGLRIVGFRSETRVQRGPIDTINYAHRRIPRAATVFARATSGANGYFVIAKPGRGDLSLAIRGQSHAIASYVDQPAARLACGDSEDIDIGDVLCFATMRVHGRVLDGETKNAIPGARVRTLESGPTFETRSQADGRFIVAGIVNASWLLVSANGYGDAMASIAKGESTTIELRRPGSCIVHVRDARTKQAIPKANLVRSDVWQQSVTLKRVDSAIASFITACSESTPTRIRASAPGYESQDLEIRPPRSGEGTTTREHVVHLKAQTRVFGTLFDEAGKPIADAPLHSFRNRESQLRPFRPILIHDGSSALRSDDEGRFELLVNRGDRLTLRCLGCDVCLRADGTSTQVTARGAEMRVEYVLAARAVEFVVESRNGRPIAGASVELSAPMPITLPACDARGRTTVALPREQGALRAIIRAQGYGTRLVDIAAQEQREQIRVPLDREAQLRVLCVASDGKPLAGCTVYMWPPSTKGVTDIALDTSPLQMRWRSDSRGVVHARNLSPGRWRLRIGTRQMSQVMSPIMPVSFRSRSASETWVQLRAGESKRLEVLESSQATVDVYVRWLGKPVAGTRVKMQSTRGGKERVQRTDSNGCARFIDTMAGPYRLRVVSAGFEFLFERHVTPKPLAQDVHLHLIGGKLTLLFSRPAPKNCRLHVRTDRLSLYLRVAGKRELRLAPLPPDSYEVLRDGKSLLRFEVHGSEDIVRDVELGEG